MNLRRIIEHNKEVYGKLLKDLTVLASTRDPYRLDTKANYALGAWLQLAYEKVNPKGDKKHLRGLHYMLTGQVEKN